jgi:hypothetical protein
MKELYDFLRKLMEREPLVFLFLFLGALLVLIGAAGGWSVIHLVVDGQPGRIVLICFGAILSGVAVYLAWRGDRVPTIDCNTFEISIDSPQNNATCSPPIPITGRCKELPEGFELWVFGVSASGSGARYWPQRAADSTRIRNEGKWEVTATPTQWKSGDRRTYGVFLVGPNGQTLMKFRNAVGHESKVWHAITELTSDIAPCGTTIEISLK